MLFTTDQQTLDDLNIFGKHGSDSVYQIFNRTSTRGGAVILEEMFRYPLSDAQAINRRSGMIRHLAITKTVFPFSPADFDAIQPYLENTDERTKLSAQEHSVGQKLGNLIAVDAITGAIHSGITSLVALLKAMEGFITALDLPAYHPYAPDKEAIALLLAEADLKPVFSLPAKTKLNKALFIEFDVLFRFRHRELIKKIMKYSYELDVYISVAKIATERNFVFPKALPKDQHLLRLNEVYHPQVKNAIANTIEVSPQGNVIFLTGANMAGKSTFMKSVTIALYLAHMGFPIAAAAMEFSVLDGIYTTINLPDDLGMGASHFYAEVLRAKKVANELISKNLFIVFDELFRGTNVKDACEATIAFTEAFAKKRNSMFVISTHIIEAGEVLKEKCDNINFVYLPTRMDGNLPVYTYKLEQGLTADRHGMIIINNEGILDILKHGLKKNKS